MNTKINSDIFLSQINKFVTWCNEHSLQLNVSKTKEIIFDFRKNKDEHDVVEIDGQAVERVEEYKYLGVTVNERLDWSVHASNVLSNINQRLDFVRKLKYLTKHLNHVHSSPIFHLQSHPDTYTLPLSLPLAHQFLQHHAHPCFS
jgi:hypothetical protein